MGLLSAGLISFFTVFFICRFASATLEDVLNGFSSYQPCEGVVCSEDLTLNPNGIPRDPFYLPQHASRFYHPRKQYSGSAFTLNKAMFTKKKSKVPWYLGKRSGQEINEDLPAYVKHTQLPNHIQIRSTAGGKSKVPWYLGKRFSPEVDEGTELLAFGKRTQLPNNVHTGSAAGGKSKVPWYLGKRSSPDYYGE